MSKEKYYFSKSLEKGLMILSLFNRETPVLTQSNVARTLGLNMTSTYRYINTLVELGYLDKDPKTREIRPSTLCVLFCTNLMRATDHLRMIRQVVDRLHSENNISIEVAFAVDDTLVRLYSRQAEETLTYSLPDRTKNCLHSTALGKAYLSSLPEEQLAERFAAMALTVRTEQTIREKDRLIEDLETARARGYAMSEEEYLAGLLAIAAPLRDPMSGKSVGAVSFDFSVLQHSAETIRAKYADLIRQTAQSLSALLPPDWHRK
jgi:DNA-binding IclR family transcriptional regulator